MATTRSAGGGGAVTPHRLATRAAAAWTPPERVSPSVWAERHRVLSVAETDRPGPWRNDVFPYVTSIMDACEEAVRTGKIGVVLIKSGQGAGTQAILNVAGWAKVHLPGPLAYVCAKDDQAVEMARTRIAPMIESCAPLRARALFGRAHGELVDRKRFVDGPWMIVGGRAVTNLEAFPQRVIVFDELDSIQDEYPGKGDPLANALVRMASFSVPTLAVVLAHPTTSERGAGKLYYSESDQRRAFAPCAHCGTEFWLQWEHVRVLPVDAETPEQAARRADRYHYVAPCCGAEVSDAQRWAMADRTTQRSTLAPEVAAAKRWIGCHFSWLYMRKSIEELAYNWLKSEGKPAERQVVVNKQHGDVYREIAREADSDAWRRCITTSYALGTVPCAAQFLTSGQDSRGAELHWAVWGWGLVRDVGGHPHLCGWLIDCGVEERRPPRPTLEAADLAVFNQLLYARSWPRGEGDAGAGLWVARGLHDAGWQPIAAYLYCMGRRDGRAFPSKGAGLNDVAAATRSPVAMQTRPGFRDPVTGEVFREAHEQHAILNTFALKGELTGMVDVTFPGRDGTTRTRIALPRDVPARFIAESGSEFLTRNERGRMEWRKRAPNHFADCNVMALGAALDLMRALEGKTREEIEGAASEQSAKRVREEREVEWRRATGAPEGGWWNGSRRDR